MLRKNTITLQSELLLKQTPEADDTISIANFAAKMAAMFASDDESMVANSVDSDCTICPSPSILQGLSSLGIAKSRLLSQHSGVEKETSSRVGISQKNSFDETSSDISEPLVPTSILQNIIGNFKNSSSRECTRYIGVSRAGETSPEFPHLPKLRKLTEHENADKIVGCGKEFRSFSKDKQDSADIIQTEVSEDDKIDNVSTGTARNNIEANIIACAHINATDSTVSEPGKELEIENQQQPDPNFIETQTATSRKPESLNNRSQNESHLINDGVHQLGISKSVNAEDKLMDVEKQQDYVGQLLQIGQSTETLKTQMTSLQVKLKLLGEANKKEKSEIMQQQSQVVSTEGRMELKRRLVSLASRHRTLIQLLLKQKQLAAKFQMILDKSKNPTIDVTGGQSQSVEKLSENEKRKKKTPKTKTRKSSSNITKTTVTHDVLRSVPANGNKDVTATAMNNSDTGMVTNFTSNAAIGTARNNVQRTASIGEKDSVSSAKKSIITNTREDTNASQIAPDGSTVHPVRVSAVLQMAQGRSSLPPVNAATNLAVEVYPTVSEPPKQQQYITIVPKSSRIVPLQPGYKITVISRQKDFPATSAHVSHPAVKQHSTDLRRSPRYQVNRVNSIPDTIQPQQLKDTIPTDGGMPASQTQLKGTIPTDGGMPASQTQLKGTIPTGGCMPASQTQITESHENSQMTTDIGNSKMKKTVSLRSLIEQKVIQPGKDVLTFINQGEITVGNLMQSGVIQDSSGECFCNPSQWLKSVTGKKRVSRSTAWAEVKYKGQPLNGFTLPAVVPVSHQDGNIQLSTANGMSSSGNCPELTEGTSAPTSFDSTLNIDQHLTTIFHNCRINLISNNELSNWHGILPEDFWQKSDFEIPMEWMDDIEF